MLEQRHPGVSAAARLSFALGFIALRLLGWMPALARYLRDLRELAPEEPLVVGIMATTALIITGLQIFWGCKVVRGLADAILGRAALPPDEAAAAAVWIDPQWRSRQREKAPLRRVWDGVF